ncbi:MAG: GGDEF domain-containing protein [Acidimicrobiia bacterium]|nr:GGDEF domain-containing protein [Acidimicrobiia bacterium]
MVTADGSPWRRRRILSAATGDGPDRRRSSRSSDDGFLVLDDDGHIRYASGVAAEQFTGIPSAGPRRSFTSRVPRSVLGRGTGRRHLRHAPSGGAPGGTASPPSEMRVADGSTVHVEIGARPDPPIRASVRCSCSSTRSPARARSTSSSARWSRAVTCPTSCNPSWSWRWTTLLRRAARSTSRWDGASFHDGIGTGVDDALLMWTSDGEVAPWEEAARSTSDVVLPSLTAERTRIADDARRRGLESLWSLPVAVAEGDVVVLTLWRTAGRARRGVGTTDVRSVRLHMTALAFEHERSAARLRHAAHHDPLTGAPNRAVLYTHLEEVVGNSSTPSALLYLDLDGFKEINDRHGHPVGDLVLRSVVERLDHGLRPGDVLARLGGGRVRRALRGGRQQRVRRPASPSVSSCPVSPGRSTSPGRWSRSGCRSASASPRSLSSSEDADPRPRTRRSSPPAATGKGTWPVAGGRCARPADDRGALSGPLSSTPPPGRPRPGRGP